MTVIPLDQLGSPSDDGLRRDRWGRLLVVPPGGTEPVGYTRVTTVAKATDEGGGLAPWKATAAVVGTMRRPGLRAKWEALVSAHNGDPWYASSQSKAACKRLVEESAEAGGATDRREQGTALHAITAQVDRGEALHHLTGQTEADVTAYVNTLADAGVSIACDPYSGEPAVETTVVLDGDQVGGTFDRVVNVTGFARPLVADLKTGADLTYSWSSFAVQCAGYAHASAIYVQGADPNGSTDMREPMIDVDQRHALIIWLPAGAARCELHLVDIEAGWQGFELSMAVRRWRQRKGLSVALPGVERRIVATPAPAPVPAAPQTPLQARQGVAAVDAVRRWLQDRIDVCGRHSDRARADLIAWWPAGMPPLTRSDDHDADALAAIERLLDDIEARYSVPFGPPKPGDERRPEGWVDRLAEVFPRSTVTTKTEIPNTNTQEPTP